MKKILIIGTGGTIASKETENGLTPGMDSSELLERIPAISQICDVDCVQPFSLDSTNIRPGHWLILSEVIRNNYGNYDGFVITHGTDTLAYTAAGLSYLIQNSEKPVVITGAQKPICDDGTDAKQNLTDALVYASDSESHYVSVVFSGAVICGTRARKNFSKSFTAFGSINFPEIARIRDMRIIRYVTDAYSGKVSFADYLDPKVGLLKLTPGVSNEVLGFMLDTYDGLVIESYGVGGLPEYSDFYLRIKQAAENGKLICMTTQVPNEGSDLSVYRVGNILKNSSRVLEAHDMTTEAAVAKLMWILGCTSDFGEAQEMFYTAVNRDILL